MANIPKGWHLCDGTDGTPNLLDNRFLEGDATPGISKDPGLPNLEGTAGLVLGGSGTNGYAPASGVFAKTTYTNGFPVYSGEGSRRGFLKFDASRSNLIYGSSDTVQPKAYTVMYIIKMK